MKGGLLQLATVGKADSMLNKPQIFIQKIYKKYTNLVLIIILKLLVKKSLILILKLL